jgi:hypothetical protein
MMLIGTSFGGCLKSILAGEVSEDDVLVIIARTAADNVERLIGVAEKYFSEGNSYARNPERYDFINTDIDLEKVRELARRLYESGKIHQPRLFPNGQGYWNPNALWLEVSPVGSNKHPAVIEAYEKYLMLDSLTK